MEIPQSKHTNGSYIYHNCHGDTHYSANSGFYLPRIVKQVSAFGLSNDNKWQWCLWVVAVIRQTHSPRYLPWSGVGGHLVPSLYSSNTQVVNYHNGYAMKTSP